MSLHFADFHTEFICFDEEIFPINMAYSIASISQEEAEDLMPGLPGADVATQMSGTRKGQSFVVKDDTWRLLQDQAPDTSAEHRRRLSGALTGSEVRRMMAEEGLSRANIAILVNMPGKYTLAVAPVYKDNKRVHNTFRPLAKEATQALFKNSADRHRQAMENKNIEEIDGRRQFMYPTLCVLPGEGPRSRLSSSSSSSSAGGVARVLGDSSARAAAARKAFEPDELTGMLTDALNDVADNVNKAYERLIDVCNGDDELQVPGLFRGRVDGNPELVVVPSDHTLNANKDVDPLSRQIDLLNHSMSGTTISLPLHKDRLKRPPSKSSEISDYALSRPDPATSIPTSKSEFQPASEMSSSSSSSSSANKKRSAASSSSSSGDNKKVNKSGISSSVVPPSSTSDGAEILEGAVKSAYMAKLATLTSGAFDMQKLDASVGSAKTEGTPLHPAVHTAAVLASGFGRKKMIEAVNKILSTPDGGIEANIVADMKKQTMWDMLMVPTVERTNAQSKVFAPFVAAAMSVFLRNGPVKSLDAEANALVDMAYGNLEEMDAQNKSLKKEVAQKDALAEQMTKERDAATEQLEAVKKELADAKAALEQAKNAAALAPEIKTIALAANCSEWSDDEE